MKRRYGAATVATACVVGAIAASGIAYAATSLPSAVVACENSKGALGLVSSDGRCARGYTKVSIGKTGPRGPQGEPGAPGPGAISMQASSASAGSPSFHDYPLAGFGITARAVCSPGGQSSVYLIDTAASTDVDIRGTATRSTSGSGLVVWSNGTAQNTPIPAGTSLQSYHQTATTQNTAFEVVDTGGELDADLIVTRGERTFTLRMYAVQTPSTCLVQAQVTPAG